MAKTNRNLLIIRWTARIIALFFILIMLLISIGEIMDSGEGGSPKGVEWLGILFMPVGVVVGLILAWKWEGLGGFIAFLSLIGFHLFLVLRDEPFRFFLFPYLISIPSILFMIYWYLTRSTKGT